MNAVTLPISEARKQLNTLDAQLATSPIIYVTRHGKPVFAIADSETFEAMDETLKIMSAPKFCEMFHQSLEDIKQGRVCDQKDVERELG